LIDVDDNEYIDYQLAWGPMILGYAHPVMVEAVARQAGLPHSYGAQHELEITVAERVQAMVPCAERVAFTSSGSEAVQLALRLARAHAARPLIVKFEGHYHGWMDNALWSYKPSADQAGPFDSPRRVAGSRGQPPAAGEGLLLAPWNRLNILERILEENTGQVAAILMEAILCNSGCLLPVPGFLQAVRELADRHGALLIFDEVITGFRVGPGGAQQLFGVTPDLATFGKAIGGGLPLSAVAGRREIMEQMFTGDVVFGGTFNGNPVSLGGADACLRELGRDDAAPLRHANAIGAELMAAMQALADRHGVRLRVTGVGTAFYLHFTKREELDQYRDTLEDNRAVLSRFLQLALEEGVVLVPDGRVYVSAAHTKNDLDETVERLGRAFARLG
jgi:glutamate-1-semialdehyde 2,1-aminomutase